MRNETSNPMEFPFELVIRRRGFFLMPKCSFHEWGKMADFNQKMRRQKLVALPMEIPGYYIEGSNVFYKIVYDHGSY